MPWFKVDDKLHSHKKALKAGEALSLWVVAGSWCMDHLTDGFIPDYVALRMVPNADKHASRLVSCELWHTDEQDGEAGWRFHDWDEYQPTKEDVDAKRESDRDRKRRQRRNERGQYEESQRSHAVTPNGVTPSRPDPTRPSPVDAPRERDATRGTRISIDFEASEEMERWASRETPTVDVEAATVEFVDYWLGVSGSKGVKRDWPATWRNHMRRCAEQGRFPRKAALRPAHYRDYGSEASA